ncbi:MAG: sulfur carrier protein ThiS [Thiocapsa sp.]|uniref:sulfur carrier protein ThiS n=1 Tax=Thiocapsa sp. TaxID=2024551 RepID=UPI001BD0F505|nr:sulfur carrier protein ThiS [Thiocapsa sp.]QVL47722.1 MAG: sulfur carrier protein ThiS [Thiocapsa sp.]
MQIILNGAATEVADALTMAELIEQLELGTRRLAIEVNAELVPRSCFSEHRLAPQDQVEIIHAVGGG